MSNRKTKYALLNRIFAPTRSAITCLFVVYDPLFNPPTVCVTHQNVLILPQRHNIVILEHCIVLTANSRSANKCDASVIRWLCVHVFFCPASGV
jgi:hypothetical protein